MIDKVGELPDRKYAVIIDEAHSSQGGEASKKMKEVLSAKEQENNDTDEEDYTDENFIREQVEKSAAARGQQLNISFFAFTATPKYKNLAVFGHKGIDLPAPHPRKGEYCIYVLKCKDNSFYIGQTDNFERRLKQHNNY